MKVLAAVLAAAAVAVATAHDFPTEDNVIVLDDSNFDEAVNAFDTLLVEFYAPWCGHCKALAPEYAKAAATLQESDLYIAKVDATENRELGDKFDVRGFPTLKFFRGGKPTDYDGGRTEAEIVQWVTKKSGPAFVTLEDADAVTAFAADNEVAVVGFFADAASADAEVFKAVAAAVDVAPFAIVSDAAAATAAGVSDGAVVAFRQFEGEEDSTFEGDLTEADLSAFVSTASLPLVIPFSSANANKIFSGPIMTHFLLFVDPAADASADVLAAFRQAAIDRKGSVLYITVGPEEDRVMGYFDISAADTPAAVLVNMPAGSSMKKYAFDGDLASTDSLVAFVDDFAAGNLKPYLKSEPIPEDGEDYDGHVKVIVGKSFETVALDTTKDVLVEFYAPWCGHCKALAPEYEKAAEHFKDVDSVVLAKVDATANEVDHPDVNVQGFPTLLFFPAGSSSPITFEGDRTEDGIVEWVTKNAASDLSAAQEEEL